MLFVEQAADASCIAVQVMRRNRDALRAMARNPKFILQTAKS